MSTDLALNVTPTAAERMHWFASQLSPGSVVALVESWSVDGSISSWEVGAYPQEQIAPVLAEYEKAGVPLVYEIANLRIYIEIHYARRLHGNTLDYRQNQFVLMPGTA